MGDFQSWLMQREAHKPVIVTTSDRASGVRCSCSCGAKFLGEDAELDWRKHHALSQGIPDLLVSERSSELSVKDADRIYEATCKQVKALEIKFRDEDVTHINARIQLMQKLLRHQFVPPADERTSAHLVRLQGVIHSFLAQRHALPLLHPVTPVQLDPTPSNIVAPTALNDAMLECAAHNPISLDYSSGGDDDDDDDDDDNEGDEDDEDDDDDGDDASSEEHEEQSSSPPVLQLDYEIGGSLSSGDPIARLLCDFRREYNAATIRLHALEGRTTYPTATASSELHQLRALLKRIQQARPPTVNEPATVHWTETFTLEFRKLEELVNDQIGELCDRLELLNMPSSRAEVAATFDPSLPTGIDNEPDMVHQHASTCDSQLPPAAIETTPHKEDCVHRGILFQYYP